MKSRAFQEAVNPDFWLVQVINDLEKNKKIAAQE